MQTRFWFYQDFAAGSGPALTITDNENGTYAATFDSANIIANSAVITNTSGNPIYSNVSEDPSTLVTVTGNVAGAVTLSGTPAVAQGIIRIWYLYADVGLNMPADSIVAPLFVWESRSTFIDLRYLNAALNLSDLTSASTARTNLGFTNQTAGKVLLGTGGTDFTSVSTFHYISATDYLGIGKAAPAAHLHVTDTDASGKMIILEGTGALATRFVEVDISSAGLVTVFNQNTAGVALSITNAHQVGIGTSTPGARLGVVCTSTSEVGILVNAAAGATADLSQWKVNGTQLANIDASGNFTTSAYVSATSLRLVNGANYQSFASPALGGNLTYTLPNSYGTSGYVLSSDGAGVLSWVVNGVGTVNAGVAGRLALYPASASAVDDQYTQNANLIDIQIATHATLAASRTYTIEDSGANASFVMTEGAQTINAIKTFSAAPLFKSGIDIEDPGAGTNKVTITTGIVSASYSVSLPLAQGAANTAMVNDGSGVLSWTRVFLASGKKADTVTVASGATTKAITFGTTFGSTNYSIKAILVNTTDATQTFQPMNVISKSATGFTLEWSDPMPTANYSIDWAIEEFYDP